MKTLACSGVEEYNISGVAPSAVVTDMYPERLADVSVEQHHVRPQGGERQHVRGAGSDPERSAGIFAT